MKVVVLYRPNSDHSRLVEEFAHDFVRGDANRRIDLVDVDSPDGIAKCELYNIVQYPSIVALDNEGKLLRSWSGDLPLMSELSYYAQSS